MKVAELAVAEGGCLPPVQDIPKLFVGHLGFFEDEMLALCAPGTRRFVKSHMPGKYRARVKYRTRPCSRHAPLHQGHTDSPDDLRGLKAVPVCLDLQPSEPREPTWLCSFP